jgi:hypothetical protein
MPKDENKNGKKTKKHPFVDGAREIESTTSSSSEVVETSDRSKKGKKQENTSPAKRNSQHLTEEDQKLVRQVVKDNSKKKSEKTPVKEKAEKEQKKAAKTERKAQEKAAKAEKKQQNTPVKATPSKEKWSLFNFGGKTKTANNTNDTIVIVDPRESDTLLERNQSVPYNDIVNSDNGSGKPVTRQNGANNSYGRGRGYKDNFDSYKDGQKHINGTNTGTDYERRQEDKKKRMQKEFDALSPSKQVTKTPNNAVVQPALPEIPDATTQLTTTQPAINSNNSRDAIVAQSSEQPSGVVADTVVDAGDARETSEVTGVEIKELDPNSPQVTADAFAQFEKNTGVLTQSTAGINPALKTPSSSSSSSTEKDKAASHELQGDVGKLEEANKSTGEEVSGLATTLPSMTKMFNTLQANMLEKKPDPTANGDFFAAIKAKSQDAQAATDKASPSFHKKPDADTHEQASNGRKENVESIKNVNNSLDALLAEIEIDQLIGKDAQKQPALPPIHTGQQDSVVVDDSPSEKEFFTPTKLAEKTSGEQEVQAITTETPTTKKPKLSRKPVDMIGEIFGATVAVSTTASSSTKEHADNAQETLRNHVRETDSSKKPADAEAVTEQPAVTAVKQLRERRVRRKKNDHFARVDSLTLYSQEIEKSKESEKKEVTPVTPTAEKTPDSNTSPMDALEQLVKELAQENAAYKQQISDLSGKVERLTEDLLVLGKVVISYQRDTEELMGKELARNAQPSDIAEKSVKLEEPSANGSWAERIGAKGQSNSSQEENSVWLEAILRKENGSGSKAL